ncbi:MAG: formate transporter FocA [Planctomycetes bacterium]|nr:formate transporter FocA [Planctomycetota bacterium]
MDIGTTFDALLPRQIAAKAEDAGVAKAKLDALETLLLAILAGAFIALGAVFSTTVGAGAAGVLPFGLARLVSGVAFCLGLILVVIAGAELFTGNNLLLMAFASRKISLVTVLRNWGIVYVGNFAGAAATAVGMMLAGHHEMGKGVVGKAALDIAAGKCALAWDQAFVRGAYCNALVCLAVWLCMSCRTTGDKVLAIVFPVTAFVAAGFEHSIANMYFVPVGLLIKGWAGAGFWESAGTAASAYEGITLSRFVWNNLIPVTLGNVVGGGIMVGSVYWVVYCRSRPR